MKRTSEARQSGSDSPETERQLAGILTERSRGQVGAATIIILIASLLVAASTAAILFNVTEVLQSQAETTEQSVGAESKDALRSAAMTGRVDTTTDPPSLTEVRVIVGLDSEDTSVDLDEAVVRLETEEGVESLAYDAGGPTAGETFGVEALSDPDGSAPTLTSVEDRFAIRMVPPPLTVHDRVTVRIHLDSGGTKVVHGRVPSGARTNDAVTLD